MSLEPIFRHVGLRYTRSVTADVEAVRDPRPALSIDGLGEMLRFYISLATSLHRGRALVWCLALLGIGGFAATLFFSEGRADEAYMLASLTLLLWSICLLVLVYSFIHPLPEIRGEDGFFMRAKKRLAIAMRWVTAWIMTLLCIALVYVTFRAASIALQSLATAWSPLIAVG